MGLINIRLTLKTKAMFQTWIKTHVLKHQKAQSK